MVSTHSMNLQHTTQYLMPCVLVQVFRESVRDRESAGADALKSRYGDASGKLFDDSRHGRGSGRPDEVYRLGGSSWR